MLAHPEIVKASRIGSLKLYDTSTLSYEIAACDAAWRIRGIEGIGDIGLTALLNQLSALTHAQRWVGKILSVGDRDRFADNLQ